MLRLVPRIDPADDLVQKNIAVIGLGTMGTAIAEGVAIARKAKAEKTQLGRLYCSTRRYNFQRNSAVTSESVVLYLEDDPDANLKIAKMSDLVIIAVKPDQIQEVLGSINSAVTQNTLIVSIARGVNLKSLGNALPPNTAIIRCAPSLSIVAQHGFTALACNQYVQPRDARAVCALFELLGSCMKSPEENLAAISAISDLWPVYMLNAISNMERAALELGLPREISQATLQGALIGAAQMMLKGKITLKKLFHLLPDEPKNTLLKYLTQTDLANVTHKALLKALQFC